ncbi:hypothetical protein [Citrobacter freundii]|uniref:Uncharacterized protein n=1 Tax=Citrobacter freundii TaxID=546 RepID=A0A7G2IHH9_CITFR|nr:hypothetical protein [Citrobacter freundii]
MSLIDLIKDNTPQIVEFVDKAESLFLYFILFVFFLAVLIIFIGYVYDEIKSGEAIDNFFSLGWRACSGGYWFLSYS